MRYRIVDVFSDRPLAGNQLCVVLDVDGEDALDVWAKARRALPETGRYPVIAGGEEEGEFSYDPLQVNLDAAESLVVEDGYSAGDALAEAEELSVETWFTERADYLDIGQDELSVERPLPAYEWPKDPFTADSDVLSGEPLDSVAVVLMPTSRSWEVPAYFLWGGWNDNPWSHEHVMLLRHWSETYGADVVAMTDAVVEVTVSEPPTSEDEAVVLAREHFLYAPDIVWQGTGDLAVLASAVQNAPVWYFWWD